MSKVLTLEAIAKSTRTDVKLIREYALESDNLLATKLSMVPDTPFTSQEMAQIREVSQLLSSLKPTKNGVVLSTSPVSSRVSNFVMQVAAPIKQRTFLAEMALVFLVSSLEAFIKDYVLQVLIDNPKMLRSGEPIKREYALGFSNMKSLCRALAELEVESLGYGSIDDVAKHFEKKLGVTLSNFGDWYALRENFYRRNLVVHNRSLVNETYRKKVEYKGNTKILDVNMAYVGCAAARILDFIDYVHFEIAKKHGKAAT